MARKKTFNEYIIKDNVVSIKIKYAGDYIWTDINLSDLKKLLDFGYRWYGKRIRKDGKIYAQTNVYENGRHKLLMLHQFLLDTPNSLIDHIDNNSLNNKRDNLRKTNNENNSKNRSGKNKNNTSGYRNVTRMGNWWRAQLSINGKNIIFPEKFEDVHEAGKFAKEMRKKYYGEYSGN